MKTLTEYPTPETDALWDEFWRLFPNADSHDSTRGRMFVALRMKEMERRLALAREALDVPVREAVQSLHEAGLHTEAVTLGSYRSIALAATAPKL